MSFIVSYLIKNRNDSSPEDAAVLEVNSRSVCARVKQIDANCMALIDAITSHPLGTIFISKILLTLVATIHHPSITRREEYDKYRRLDGGYGGLFSMVLHERNPAIVIGAQDSNAKAKDKIKLPSRAQQFYNHLDVCKGPSLGTNFTLACPYTMYAC